MTYAEMNCKLRFTRARQYQSIHIYACPDTRGRYDNINMDDIMTTFWLTMMNKDNVKCYVFAFMH